jgi:ribosomal protein L11 methyltransferase
VCFPWSELDRDAVPLDVEVVEIDPGTGFGTGRHPSTRLLLEALEARLRGGERVADVGCGSGVLAVAAVRLGAACAAAVDVVEGARRATVANAAANGVAGLVELPGAGAGVDDLEGTFDVIVANIGAAPLVELSDDLRSRLRPGGWIALSGLSPAQLSKVAAAYRPLREADRLSDGEWAALVLVADPADRPTVS